jgi:hypothetical protein
MLPEGIYFSVFQDTSMLQRQNIDKRYSLWRCGDGLLPEFGQLWA